MEDGGWSSRALNLRIFDLRSSILELRFLRVGGQWSVVGGQRSIAIRGHAGLDHQRAPTIGRLDKLRVERLPLAVDQRRRLGAGGQLDFGIFLALPRQAVED